MAAQKKRTRITLAAIIMVVAIVLSSFVYLNSQKPYSGAVENVSYANFDSEAHAFMYIAQDQNFFTSNGINLTIRSVGAGAAAINAVSSGTVDIIPSSDFSFVTNSAMQGKNLTVIATVDKSVSIFLVARRDSGIENPADLNGKRIGLTLQSAGEFYLGRFLDLQGLNIHQVNLVNLPPAQYVNAITNGTVDAIVSIQPTVGTIQSQLGTNAVTWSLQSEQPAYLTLVCRSDWATQHQDLVIRFLKSLSQAEDYLINHKAAAQAIVEKRLNETISQDTWSNNQYTLSLDQSLILAMRDEAQWLISNNLTNTTSVPNFLDYIFTNGLESVKPGAVNIIG